MNKRTRSFELIHIIYRIEMYCLIIYIAIVKLIYLLFMESKNKGSFEHISLE
jgi:hypothetical protein